MSETIFQTFMFLFAFVMGATWVAWIWREDEREKRLKALEAQSQQGMEKAP